MALVTFGSRFRVFVQNYLDASCNRDYFHIVCHFLHIIAIAAYDRPTFDGV